MDNKSEECLYADFFLPHGHNTNQDFSLEFKQSHSTINTNSQVSTVNKLSKLLLAFCVLTGVILLYNKIIPSIPEKITKKTFARESIWFCPLISFALGLMGIQLKMDQVTRLELFYLKRLYITGSLSLIFIFTNFFFRLKILTFRH